MNERLAEIACPPRDESPPGVPVPLQPPAGGSMNEADELAIANIVRAVLIQTLHPSVLRPAPATLPIPANDPEPDPPLHAA
ncbi:hypothetical protein D3C72_828780 [compost metagenome]